MDRFNKSYDKEIFPLYKSYSHGAGKESAIDKRQNILNNPKFWGMATKRGGIVFVAKKRREEVKQRDEELFVYRPKFRDLNYFKRLLSPLLSGKFSVNRTVPTSTQIVSDNKPVPDGAVPALLDQPGDVMVFSGRAGVDAVFCVAR